MRIHSAYTLVPSRDGSEPCSAGLWSRAEHSSASSAYHLPPGTQSISPEVQQIDDVFAAIMM